MSKKRYGFINNQEPGNEYLCVYECIQDAITEAENDLGDGVDILEITTKSIGPHKLKHTTTVVKVKKGKNGK